MGRDNKSESNVSGCRKESVKSVASKQKNNEIVSQYTNDKLLLHELQVHQGELKMQNEELQRLQHELQVTHDRYFALYDLAPMSYCTLTEQGQILEANFTAATLLGLSRSALLNQPISRFIATDDLKSFVQHTKKLLETHDSQTWELRMLRHDGSHFWVLMKADVELVAAGAPTFRIVMIDINDRKLFEETILENGRRLSEIIDLSPAGYFRIDRAGCFQRVNRAWLQMHGYDSPDEIIGRHYLMVQVEDEQQAAQRLVDRMLAGEDIPSSGKFSRKYKDGSIGYHTFSIRPIMQGGEIIGLEGFFIDRTDQQRIELVKEFLAKTCRGERDEPFFNVLARFLARNLEMEFICIDRLEGDGLNARNVAVWCDGHFEDNLTYALKDTLCGEVVGKAVCCFPADICRLFPRDQVLQDMRAESYIGVTLFGHTGQPIGLIACVGRRPLVNRPLAEAIMVLVAVRAAAEMERLEAETALRMSEEKYRTLFHEMLEGCALHEIICDGEGAPVDYRFLAANPAFERITGLRVEEIVGRTVLEVLPHIEPFWIETYGKVALSGEPTFFEQYSAELNKYFEVTVFRPASNQFSCIIEDITEHKRAEQEKAKLETQLHHAQKMESVGRLAGGVAHDFNNMLGVILGHAYLVLMEMDPSHPYYANLEEIRKATERSADLTRQLLAFARKQAIAPKVLELNSTVTGMLKMLQRLIGEDIKLVWQPMTGLWPIKVDPSQIDQILANLCVNARDAIADVGLICIETKNCILDESYCSQNTGSAPGEYVRLTVSDNGCGMDKKTLDQIFEPFFTTKGVGKGTGLGLAMVYGAVKQNNGYITVYSEPGHGTTFTIYLPRHVENSAHKDVESAQKPLTGGWETILVVEDEPTILRMTAMSLEKLGYTVLRANATDMAISLAGAHSGEIHLLLTDVIMPEMNGRDLAHKLLSFYPQLKCLFMSGYTADVISHHGVLDEGINFIQKPFSVPDLAVKVREALDEL